MGRASYPNDESTIVDTISLVVVLTTVIVRFPRLDEKVKFRHDVCSEYEQYMSLMPGDFGWGLSGVGLTTMIGIEGPCTKAPVSARVIVFAKQNTDRIKTNNFLMISFFTKFAHMKRNSKKTK